MRLGVDIISNAQFMVPTNTVVTYRPRACGWGFSHTHGILRICPHAALSRSRAFLCVTWDGRLLPGRWELAAATWAVAEFSGSKKLTEPWYEMELSERQGKTVLTGVFPVPSPEEKGSEMGLRPAASLQLCPPIHMAIEGWRVRVRSLSFWLGSLPGGRPAC